MSLTKYNTLRENENSNRGRVLKKRDKWRRKTDATIQGFIERYLTPIVNESSLILNITSTRKSLGLAGSNIDYIALSNLLTNSTSEAYDIIICDRNLINRFDPMIVFEAFQKILRPQGLFVFNFKNSNALEFLLKKDFNRMAVFTNAVYNKQKEWHYSDSWINELLALNKFEIIKTHKFHYFFSRQKENQKNERKLRRVFELDMVFRNIPFVRSQASNTIILCKKMA
ncbi:MAG TPA: hypothetical protein VK622_05780 [Puia sp.]|nr:hypothetical protein [Puia sp.]HTE27525.1 hypothetical protein [Flavitalea sp.]